MGIVLIFVLLLSVIFTYLLLRHRSKMTQQSLPDHNSTQVYHSVSISPCSKACPNVKKLKGKLFLASEASALPVAGCTTKQCTCSYRHHQDRRSGDDRRYPVSIMTNLYADKDQRMSHNDRRHDGFEMTLEDY